MCIVQNIAYITTYITYKVILNNNQPLLNTKNDRLTFQYASLNIH